MLAYAVALLVGEQLRGALFGETEISSQMEGKKKGETAEQMAALFRPLCVVEGLLADTKRSTYGCNQASLGDFATIVLPLSQLMAEPQARSLDFFVFLCNIKAMYV